MDVKDGREARSKNDGWIKVTRIQNRLCVAFLVMSLPVKKACMFLRFLGFDWPFIIFVTTAADQQMANLFGRTAAK